MKLHRASGPQPVGESLRSSGHRVATALTGSNHRPILARGEDPWRTFWSS